MAGKSLNKLIYEIRDLVSKQSNDAILENRHYEEFIINKRVKWFENTYNKFQKQIPQIYYQTVCDEIITVDQSECCEVDTECTILRTKHKIPSFISLKDGELIQSVKGVGIKEIPYNVIPYHRVPYYGNSRYNKNSVAAFLYNEYIYLITFSKWDSLIEKITIRGVFRDPREAGSFKNCDNTPCWTPDDNFPIEERLWEYCKNDIMATDISVYTATIPDLINDNKDNKFPVNARNPQSKES